METKIKVNASAGSYITKLTKTIPSIQTLRIRYKIGKGVEATTAIAGGISVQDLSEYRNATSEEICKFLEMELKSYRRLVM